MSLLDPSQYFLVARLKYGGVEIDRAIKPLSLPKYWKLPEASLSVNLKKINDKTFELIISTNLFARVVMIEPIRHEPTASTNPLKLMEQCDVMVAGDNYFDLLAGESRTVLIQLRDFSCVDGFDVRAWNADTIRIKYFNHE